MADDVEQLHRAVQGEVDVLRSILAAAQRQHSARASDDDDAASDDDIEDASDSARSPNPSSARGNKDAGSRPDVDLGGDVRDMLGLGGLGLGLDLEDEFEDGSGLDISDDELSLASEELEEEPQGPNDSIELRPGEVLVPGSRLASLFQVLETNRALQEHLRKVMTKVERVIDRNWEESDLMLRPAEGVQRPGAAQADDQAAAGPGEQAAQGTAGAAGGHGISRYWRINGRAPAAGQGLAEVADALQQLPTSFERVRWSKLLTDVLKQGVLSEVQHLLTERALKRFTEQAESEQGATNAGMADLSTEFARIKTLTLESDEAARLVLELGPEQWARVSSAHVKDRSPLDCRIYYLHNLAPQRPWALEESARLRELVEKHKEHRWDLIATELGTGRTAAQCLQHYVKFSRPQHLRQRQLWTAEDDAELRAMVEQFGTNWVRISKEMNHRFDRHQLRDRWHGQTQRKHTRKTGRWEPAEDQRLLQVHGFKWPAIALAVRTRTAQQCRERYNNVLDPNLKTEPFSEEERKLLNKTCEEQLKAHGRIVWAQVAKLFSGRTDEACRRVWRSKGDGVRSKLRGKRAKGTGATASKAGRKQAAGASSSEEDEMPEEDTTDGEDAEEQAGSVTKRAAARGSRTTTRKRRRSSSSEEALPEGDTTEQNE